MIVSKKRNKTEDIFLFYAKFNISTYEKTFEHPISNFIKKSEVRSHKKGRLHEKYIPYSQPFMLFLSYYLFILSYYLFSFKV